MKVLNCIICIIHSDKVCSCLEEKKIAPIKHEGKNHHNASCEIVLYLLLPDFVNTCIKESTNKLLIQ